MTDNISALRRESQQAPAELNPTRDARAKPVVAPIGQYAPALALRSAVQDASLLAIGAGDGWLLTPAPGVAAGEETPMRLEYTRGTTLPKPSTIARASADGAWHAIMPSQSRESAFDALAPLLDAFLHMACAVSLSAGCAPRAVQLPIAAFAWVGERFLGGDGQPNPDARTPELAARNAKAVAMATAQIKGISLDRQPFAQPHVLTWRLALPGVDALLLGYHVASFTFFLCRGQTAHCAYSVEDLLALALSPAR